MSGIRGKDTQPELVLRRLLFRRGVRFRLHASSLPGRPDIVIRRYRVALFVHGCFWHAHANCRYFKLPVGNRSFWAAKLGKNSDRDARSKAALLASGWRVGVVWECALRANPDCATDLVLQFLHGGMTQIDVSEGMVAEAPRPAPGLPK